MINRNMCLFQLAAKATFSFSLTWCTKRAISENIYIYQLKAQKTKIWTQIKIKAENKNWFKILIKAINDSTDFRWRIHFH